MVDASRGEQCRYYENPLNWDAVGPTGTRGPTGPTGPRGPSDAWQGSGDSIVVGGTPTTIASVSLPAGNFFVVGKTWIFDAVNPTHDECYLLVGASNLPLDLSSINVDKGRGEALSVQSTVTLPTSATVSLKCDGSDLSSLAFDGKIDAIQIATLH